MSSGFPQAVMTFSAIPDVIGGSVTMARGISPGIAQLYMPTKPSLITTVGDLVITYNGRTVTLRNCAVNTHTLKLEKIPSQMAARRTDPNMWTVQVMDRRWQWRYKKISGEYNVRLPNCVIRYSTKHTELRKSIFELGTLCLQAMGEVNFDCSVLPTDVYPYVNWHDANPASELQTLCDMVGCVVVYDWYQNRVVVSKLGVGSPLPTSYNAQRNEIRPVTVTRRPDKIAVACGPSRYQIKFALEAVGLEHDGSIKKLDDLSYKPATTYNGWKKQWWCAFPNVSTTGRDMAFRTVYRWYRIKGIDSQGGSSSFSVPGVQDKIKSADQFELEDVLLEIGKDYDEMPQTQRARVSGEFWPQCPWEANTPPTAEYNATGWRILPDHKNIVEFDYPVLKIVNGEYAEAKLFLTCACKIRKENGDGYVSSYFEQGLPWQPTGAGTRILRHHELWDYSIIHPVYGSTTSQTASTESNVYLSRINGLYQSGPSEDVSWWGIIPIQLDGAIAEVQWKAGYNYAAETRASRNHEFDMFTPHLEQRRRLEKTNTTVEMELM